MQTNSYGLFLQLVVAHLKETLIQIEKEIEDWNELPRGRASRNSFRLKVILARSPLA